jgi:exodeoxyribonuclease VII large subunit
MDILAIRKVGLGELLERIERLRQQLIKDGLTLAERKKPLPFLPNLIGLITGANSDAEKDVLQNAKLRWPEVKFKVQHTPVQGDKAAGEIIKAIQALDANSEVDVIILTRGGGSFQDLLVFSDEQVVRAVANCKTPIVSAIGHENDRPLTDEVADLRASTPTDAAKTVVPDVVDERKKIAMSLERISLRVVGYVQNQLELIAGIRTRPVFANPFTIVDERAQVISQFLSSVQYQTRNFLEKEQLQIAGLRGQVRALSPKLTLDRGYAVVRTTKGGLVTDPKKVSKGEQLRVTLSGGELGVTAD